VLRRRIAPRPAAPAPGRLGNLGVGLSPCSE